MHVLKKYICILLMMIITLSFSGCGSNIATSNNNQNIPSPTVTQPTNAEDNDTKEEKKPNSLYLEGVNLVNSSGEKVQLKGISTHGIAWFPQYINKDCFSSLRDTFGINLIRIAMYTGENSGYCTGGDKDYLINLVYNGIDYATELGLYVIVDWHILSDGNPLTYKTDSIDFFEKVSSKYSDYDNIIYEICNEPNSGTTWTDIKSYANEVIPIIRNNDKDSIIVVGTPNWSQRVDEAASSPLEFDNIMYSLHFYADTHKNDLRKTMEKAINNGLPIFVTEFGICDASGSGSINIKEADKWMDLINEYNISYSIWNLSNKNETSALLKSSCTKIDNYDTEDLSESAIWFRNAVLSSN